MESKVKLCIVERFLSRSGLDIDGFSTQSDHSFDAELATSTKGSFTTMAKQMEAIKV